MVSEAPRGGGNRVSPPSIIVRRSLALGDVLCSTVVTDKLAARGYRPILQAHPAAHPILRRVRNLYSFTEPRGHVEVNLDRAYEDDPHRTQKTFHRMFIDRANQQLSHLGINLGEPTNCRPRLHVTDTERETAKARFMDYPRPWVFICPRSESYPHRQVHDGVWREIAEGVKGTKFWLGLHPAPEGIVDLKVRYLDNLIVWLSVADLLISVDTGPMHIGAALGIPIVAISQSSSPDLHLNNQNDFVSVATDLDCLNCQKNLCPKNAVMPPCQQVDVPGIIRWSNAKLRGMETESVAAIIPIYQPDTIVFNKCLEAVLPQVDEVIVSMEGLSQKPPLLRPTDRKVKYVQTREQQIGYGRNVNHGARFSNSKYLLLLNDDVFLEPGAVEKMKAAMRPDVGMACHLLRLPSGKIYPVAMDRKPGDRDWHHVDNGAWHPSIHHVTTLENCCGASVLVRREVFYDIGGFDEDFFLYAEDNDFALRVRQAGWSILYLPHVSGVHVNGASTAKVPQKQHEMIQRSGQLFHSKWDGYLRHNVNRVPGNFDYA